MIRRLVLAVLLFVILCCDSLSAYAQPIHGFATSVEVLVQNADRVFVGKVTAFDLKAGNDDPKTKIQNAPAIWDATVAIGRTIKGGHQKTVKLPLVKHAAELNDWIDKSSSLLFVVRDTPTVEATVVDLSDKDLQMIDADFTVLRNAEDVVKAAESIVHHNPGVLRTATFRLLVPNEKLANTQWGKFHGTYVIVPVDKQLEKRTIEYLKSNRYINRCEAARALRHFKSPENIALAKSLLNDDGWGYLRHPINNNGVTVRHYGVRADAYETLQYLGIDVKKPVIKETVRE